jgi:hypothetical protein
MEEDLWKNRLLNVSSDFQEAAVFTAGPVQSAIWRYGVTSFTKVKSKYPGGFYGTR